MILSTKEILRKGNYLIEYDFSLNTKCATINVFFDESGIFTVKWNPATKTIVTSWLDLIIEGPLYATPAITWLLLNQICWHYEYPIDLVDFKLDGNPKSNFMFDVLDDNDVENIEKAEMVFELTDSIIKDGLWPEDIQIAAELGIWEGLKAVCDFHLGATIEI